MPLWTGGLDPAASAVLDLGKTQVHCGVQPSTSGEKQGLLGIHSLDPLKDIGGAGFSQGYEGDVEGLCVGPRAEFPLLRRELGIRFPYDEFLLPGRQLHFAIHLLMLIL